MKVFLIGKRGNITHWVEDATAGLRAAGHEVWVGVTRNPALSRPVGRLLLSPALGVPRAVWIERAIRRVRPDIILAIMPYVMPPAILARVAAMPDRPPLVGWEGDVFGEPDRAIADMLDVMAYTDSALLPRHAALGFKARTLFLPHAASLRRFDQVRPIAQRANQMLFVASVTPRRRALIGGMAAPMALYGPGWRGFTAGRHAIYPRRVRNDQLAKLYAAHRAALNIPNELNVLAGLNQRNFTPYLSATPVLTEAQPDLERCFEPGREVLVFQDAAELDDLHARIRREPAFADSIGQRGRARVLAEHSYGHRLTTLANQIGVSARGL
jgi:spore maturation protein CgeB